MSAEGGQEIGEERSIARHGGQRCDVAEACWLYSLDRRTVRTDAVSFAVMLLRLSSNMKRRPAMQERPILSLVNGPSHGTAAKWIVSVSEANGTRSVLSRNPASEISDVTQSQCALLFRCLQGLSGMIV